MGFDYINTNNVTTLGTTAISGLDIVTSALTVKNTTVGGMSSPAMLWLLFATLLFGLGIGAGEFGRSLNLSRRDWLTAIGLFLLLAFAIFSGLVFYHVLLIASPAAALLEALLASVILFTLFMLLVAVVCAISLMMDESMPVLWIARTTNWVVAPVLILVAALLVLATNIDPVRADMLYKQAAGLASDDAATAVELYERALVLQPQQDYYLLFLGRAYLDAAKSTTDAAERTDYLQRAEAALNRARGINPYNTDHSANLARLAQARGALATEPAAALSAYREASAYFDQATRLSPNTAHLYDQHAQALLEYARRLGETGDSEGAAQAQTRAASELNRALQVDDTFCLTFAVRALAREAWRERAEDALTAIRLAPRCGDVFIGEGLAIGVNALSLAGDEAVRAGQAADFERLVNAATATHPSLESYTALANFYSKAGRISDAIIAVDGALGQIPADDTASVQRYRDFRFTLVELDKALAAVSANPNDADARRAVATQWLARGQFDLALPAFQEVIRLKPDDYPAQRQIVLLFILTDRLGDASTQVSRVQQLAPPEDKALWRGLETVLDAIASGETTGAAAQLDALAAAADPNDYALISALRSLAERLQGTG
jgi:tetratricopeptide (TPR) repeat protein